MGTDTINPPKGFNLDIAPPEGFVIDEPVVEPNAFDGLIDPNEIDKRTKDVLSMSEKFEVPLFSVERSYENIKLITDAVQDPHDIDLEKIEVISEKKVEPVLAAAEEKKTFLEKLMGFRYPAKPPNWDAASPIEKFNYAMLPLADFLGRVGGKITSDWRITTKEEAQKVLAGNYNENLEWYQKSPEMIGWSAEKVAEYFALKAVFKLSGLHRVLTAAGEKAALPFIQKSLVARGGMTYLKTLSSAGIRNLMKQSLITFLRAAPGNAAFIGSWSALDAVMKGKSPKEIGGAAIEGVGWGLAITAGLSALSPIAKAPELTYAFKKAMANLSRKYPKTADLLGKKVPQEIEKEWLKQYRTTTGNDVRLIDLTKTQRAQMRNTIRAVEKELLHAAKVEQAMRTYWSTDERMTKEAAKVAKATKIKAAEIVPEEKAKPPTERPIAEPQPTVEPSKPEVSPIVKKVIYTSVPQEWHKETDLYDWGQKGLRTKGNRAIEVKGQRARKTFIWQSDFDEVPTRLPKSTMDAFRAKTDDIYKIHSRTREDYYIVPKQVLKEVKAELGEEAFKRRPKPIRTPKQKINDLINSAKLRDDVSDGMIGEAILELTKDYGLTEQDLSDIQRAYIKEYRYEKESGAIPERIPERVPEAVRGEKDLAEREAIQAEAELTEDISDFLDGIVEEEKPHQKDLLGRPVLEGGAKGKQAEFLDKEKFRLAEPDIEGQMVIKPEAKPPAKAMKAPIEQLGGLPVEPPGLTKEEAVHLGKREQTALRAGQKLGLKIGYKKGYQEAALKGRRELNVLRMDKAISQKSKEDVRKTIQKFVPKDEQYRFMTRLGRVKDAKGVQKLTGEIEHFIEQYEHRAAVRHFKNFVSGIKKKYKSGEVAFGQLSDNLRDKVMGVIDGYDAVQISELKADELIKHKEHIQKVAGSIADAFAQWENLDEQGLDILQLPNYRIRELQRLEKTPVAELGTEEIEFIQDELEGLLAVNEKKGQVKARIRAEKLHTKVTGASNEIYSRGETKAGEIKEPGYAKRFIGIEQANLRTLVGFATKGENENTVNVLVEQLYEANRKRADKYKGFIEYARKQRDKRNITDADVSALEKPVTVSLGGKEITISQGSLLSLWMDTEAEGNMRRLLRAKGHNLRSDKGKLIRVGKIKLHEIQDAIEKLSDKAKAIGEIAFDTNANMQAPALNETWIDLYNYPIARHERHWPFPREIEKLVEGPRAEISLSMEMQGRYLPRTGGTERHNVIPFTRQFMKGLQMDAATSAMTDSMQQAKALLANRKWRHRMKDSGQQPVLNAITTMLRRSQGMVSDQSVADLVAARFLSRAGKSLLSARPSGMLIQTASVSAGYGVIEPKHFMTLTVPTKAEIAHLKEISPSLWLRWEAKQFDYALGAASAQSGFQTLIMGKQPISDRLVNHYTWGDQIAIFYGWMGAQNKVASETTLRKGTPEFEKASLDLLHRWMETQPQWDILHRSLLTSHPSPFFRGSMMFMSARNAQYNVLWSSYDDLAKGRIDEAEFATRAGGVVQANIQVSLARRLMRYAVKAGALAFLFGLSDEEDKELVKEIAKEQAVKDIKKVPFESAMNMVGLMAFGQIGATIGYEAGRQIEGKTFPKKLSEARTGNILADLTMDFMQFGIDSTKLAKQLWTQEVYVDRKRMGELRWKDTAIDLTNLTAEIVAQITGMPYSGPRSDIVWPTQSVLRGMSKDEYEKARKEFNEARRKALQKAVKQKVKEGELPRKR